MEDTFKYDINYINNKGEKQNYKLSSETELNQPQIITKCKEYNDDFFKLVDYKKLNESLLKENLWQDGSNVVSELVDRAFTELDREDAQDFLQGIVSQIKEIAEENDFFIEGKQLNESENIKTLYDLIIERGNGIDIGDNTYNVTVYFDFIEDDNDDDQKFLRKLAKELHCLYYDDNYAEVDLERWVKDNFYELDQLFDANGTTQEEEIEEFVTTVMPGIISGYTTDYVYKSLLEQPMNKTIKQEGKQPFSGVEFEKNIPHEMRFKEYDKVNVNDLYWVTQQPFTMSDLQKFKEAFKETTFNKAYITVRDFSTYMFEEDLSRNVFAIIDRLTGEEDLTGYIKEVKKSGWDELLEESKDNSTVRTEDLPQMEIYELLFNGYKEGQKIKDNVAATVEAIRDDNLSIFNTDEAMDVLINYTTMKANEIYYSKYDESKEIKTEEVLDDINEVEKEYKEAYGKDLDFKTVPCVIAKDTYLSGWGDGNPEKLYQVVLCGSSVEAANIEYTMKNKAEDEGLSNIRRAFGISNRVKNAVSYKIGRYAKVWNDLSDEWYEDHFSNKEVKTETTNKKLQTMKHDLYDRERQALKELGYEDYENLTGMKDKMPKEMYDAFEKEENELWAIEMIHSILTYTSRYNWNVDYVMNDEYMEKYIKELGRDRVEELVKQEVDEYINNATVEYAGTDSEGVSYNSVSFKGESVDSETELVQKTADEIAKEVYDYVADHGYDIKDYMDGSKESKEALKEIDDVLENFMTDEIEKLEDKTGKEYMYWYEYEPNSEYSIKVKIQTV